MLTKNELERVRDSLKAGERRLLWDTEVAGLGARVSVSRIVFVFNYRHGRVERRMTLGTSTELGTVAAARKRAAQLRLSVRAGNNPLQEVRDKRKAAETRLTLKAAVEMWLDSNPQWRPNTRDLYRNSLRKHVLPRLGQHNLDSITRQQWARLLTDVRKRSPSTAHSLRNVLGGFVAWCVESEMLTASTLPSAARFAPKPDVRERVITDEEIGRIWAAADALEPRKAAFVRFLILTAMRSGEASQTRLEWVHDGAIIYPACAMKGGKEHRVALNEWAWRQVEVEHVVGAHMFKPIGNPSDILADLRAGSGIADWRFHDLRRSFRSWAARTPSIGRDAAETALAHTIHRDDVDKAYQRHKFEDEAEAAFHRWQRHIERLVTGGDASKVVPICRPHKKMIGRAF
ncbi:MAG TPA: integrase arm-type DNA-binding domain-containing protein [Aestuariivirgaceae bacterium]|nr:integrase arm-type DNA-binding domain-containing protein [Aestuariivirgaceae bacterium]